MTTVLNINVDDIDTKFVESLKRDFAHAEVEIRLQEQIGHLPTFTDAHFWKAINMLDWDMEGDDEKVTEPLINFLSEQPSDCAKTTSHPRKSRKTPNFGAIKMTKP
jgi:hypothetical protein